MNWFQLALMSMLCYAVMQLLFKQVGNLGVSAVNILVLTFGFGFLFLLAHVVSTHEALILTPKVIGLMVVASFLSYAGNTFFLKSMLTAPNPGYAGAVANIQALVVSICAVFLFGSHFSWVKGLGVMLCMSGLYLLAL